MISVTDPIDPRESRVITFDFGPDLTQGETLSGAIILDVIVVAWADYIPSALVSGAPSFDPNNTMVLVPVSGRLPRVAYAITVTCNTSTPGKRVALSAGLPVKYAHQVFDFPDLTPR